MPRGFYADQLRHWRSFFPADRMLVLCFEELISRPAGTMSTAFRFLGLPNAPVDTSAVLNRGGGEAKEAIDPTLLADLDALYRAKNTV